MRTRAHVCATRRNGVTHVTMRVCGVTHGVTRTTYRVTPPPPMQKPTPKQEKEIEQGVKEAGKEKKGRALMPETAALVDELRAAYGAERVDAAIAAGQRAKREYAARVASDGPTLAKRWLAAQKFPSGSFWASEGGNDVGLKR